MMSIPNYIFNVFIGELTFFYLSLFVTLLATILIILRIVAVVKQSESKLGGYRLTIELVIESGMLYAAALTVTSILIALSDSHWRHNRRQISMALSCWQQSLPAVAVQPLCLIDVALGN